LIALTIGTLIFAGGTDSLMAGQAAFRDAEVGRRMGDEICCASFNLYANLKEYMERVDELWSHERDVLLIFNGSFAGWKAVRQEHVRWFVVLAGYKNPIMTGL